MQAVVRKETERGTEEVVSPDEVVKARPVGARKRTKFAAVSKTRRTKQLVSGSLFLVLLAAGWYAPLIGYFIPLCMVAGVGTAAFRGRKWCDWLCPRGSFADAFMGVVSPNRPIPAFFRRAALRVGILAFLMAMLGFQILRLWPDYYRIGGFFMLLLSITTAVGIILAVLYHPRTWCFICPIGSLSSWAGRKRYPLVLAVEKCVKCGVCGKSCPMQLTPERAGEKSMAGRGDCLKCGLCTATCRKDALSLGGEPVTGSAPAPRAV